MERISLEELVTAIDGVHATPLARRVEFDRVRLDPRAITPGDLFWAISEKSVERQEQLALAEARGAMASVLALNDAGARPGRIFVPDPRLALARFARWYRSLLDAFAIGIAGENDGVTTRNMTRAALGLPAEDRHDDRDIREQLALTLLDIAASDRYAVVAFGAGCGDAWERLVDTARPEAVILTRQNRSQSDRVLETFLAALPRGGFAILPGDHPGTRAVPRDSRVPALFVGRRSDNTHRVGGEEIASGRLKFRLDRSRFEIAAPGRHYSIPAGMAILAARRLGRRDPEIAKNLEAFEPTAGCGTIALRSPWTIIDETAGDHRVSLVRAMENVAEWPTTGRRILVYGHPSRRVTSQRARLWAFEKVDHLITIGTFAGEVAQEARRAGRDAHSLAEFSQPDTASGWLRDLVRRGDVVWITSARSAGLDRLVVDLIRHAESTSEIPMAA